MSIIEDTSSARLGPDTLTVLGRDEGTHLHVLDNLATIKATAGATGALTAAMAELDIEVGPLGEA